MNLTYEHILSITQGAVSVEEKVEGIQFHRFTKEQEEGYEKTQFHPRQYATAGVRLHFKTDSNSLYMKILANRSSSRSFFTFDILVNGKLSDSLHNVIQDSCGEYEAKFELGIGIKDVCIHFPWSVCGIIKELCLDDDSFVEPVKKDKKIIVFGDSITQGYDAENPSNRYAANLANALGAEEINKAIGGELFCPWLAQLKDDIEPDYISVAYGTNHWHKSTPEEFRNVCEEFYQNLIKNYPNAKIFALTPIWRKDRTDNTSFNNFEEIGKIVAEVVKKYDNVSCISCHDFVPEDENLFSDLFLHPNDAGFKYYSEGVTQAVSSF